MVKALVTFKSASSDEEGSLTYLLYDHPIAERWRGLVSKSQLTGARYQTDEIFYGGGLESISDIQKKLHTALDKIREEFPDILKQDIFSILQKNDFPLSQDNLNIAHVLYEKGIHEIQIVRKTQSHPIYYFLHLLNTSIHRLEAEIHPQDGFFIDTRLMNSFRAKILPKENQYFSLDQNWGELYMNYCHVGESYLNLFYNNYPSPPVPQTDIAGGIIMQFQKTQTFGDHQRLQAWLNQFFGHEVKMNELPLGLVPLGKLEGQWTPETIKEFFKRYPVFKGEIIFA